MIDLNKEAKIEGGGLDTEYQATQLHFHWSRNLTGGSEHSINGKHTAMEVRVFPWGRGAGLGSVAPALGASHISPPLSTRCT